MRAVFRVDASLQIGTGHVERCLTLAECLKDQSNDVSFICRELQGNLIKKIDGRGFDVYGLKGVDNESPDSKLFHSSWLDVTQKTDARQSRVILEDLKPDWLIVDHYALDHEWECELKNLCNRVLVIDDLSDRKHDCDYLLDQTYGQKLDQYIELVPKSCKVLLGASYSLLRPEFLAWRPFSLERRQNPKFKKLLINMGGIDCENYTELVLNSLINCDLPKDIEITIILGLHCPNIESVKERAKQLACKVKIKVDVNNMAEIMANSDIAIGASGTASWERCCLGLPTIQYVLADNQRFVAENLLKSKMALTVSESTPLEALINNYPAWIDKVGKVAASAIDGKGALRVADELTKVSFNIQDTGQINLINYVNLNLEDKLFVLEMRNHPSIKKWMHSKDDISLDDHIAFINELKKNKDKKYFLVKQNSTIIGCINFSAIKEDSTEFGIYSNPFLDRKGTGYILEQSGEEFAKSKLGVNVINLEVLKNNTHAIDFYKRAGYKLIPQRDYRSSGLLNFEKKLKL